MYLLPLVASIEARQFYNVLIQNFISFSSSLINKYNVIIWITWSRRSHRMREWEVIFTFHNELAWSDQNLGHHVMSCHKVGWCKKCDQANQVKLYLYAFRKMMPYKRPYFLMWGLHCCVFFLTMYPVVICNPPPSRVYTVRCYFVTVISRDRIHSSIITLTGWLCYVM